MSPRDPRVDPKPGDVLDLIGWRIEVVCADLDRVDFWRRGRGSLMDPQPELLTFDRARWVNEMTRHASILHTAEAPDAG